MTRQELVREINHILAEYDYRLDSIEKEALNMAIEALEQEETLKNLKKPNKSDLISRQAAIDAEGDKWN